MKRALKACVVVLTVFAITGSAVAVQPANTAGITGTWVNVNPATGAIVRIVITNAVTGFRIQTFGACSPTPCDHGSIPASRFSKSVSSGVAHGVSGTYNFGFSTMLVTAQRVLDIDGGVYLDVETRTRFAAGDTRQDYMRTELFRR